MKPLEKSFWEETGEMVHLEGMLSKALLRMHSVAQPGSFKALLADYRVVVEKNLTQLSQAFRTFEVPLREKKNDAAMALLQKAQQIILRTGSGPMLDTLLLALCLKVIALKIQSYLTLAGWAEALNAEPRGLSAVLNKLHQSEQRAKSNFDKLVLERDSAAAAEDLDLVRKRERPVTKQPFHAPGDW